jgi:hypothetical protein
LTELLGEHLRCELDRRILATEPPPEGSRSARSLNTPGCFDSRGRSPAPRTARMGLRQ